MGEYQLHKIAAARLPEPSAQKLELPDRAEILDRAIAYTIKRGGGGRVVNKSDTQAVVVTGKRPNHLLHLILSVITLGLWLLVWLTLAIVLGEKTTELSVDQFGTVTVRQ